MRPEFYADLYRRFATYLRNFGENVLFKVACGGYRDNYRWTEVLMREAGRRMDGLALHYYCGSGRESRSATDFGEGDWFEQLRNALFMDELLTQHSRIMDRYDPQNQVALLVDEWGAWHQVEPGTNPGFLFQQNSLRDALVAGATLNIFNEHCDRLKMANIAQTVNVLQAMILTEGDKMVLTPTFHVFEMYAVHQDATLLPLDLECGAYEFEGEQIPMLSASASRDQDGSVHLSLCNLNPSCAVDVSCEVRGINVATITGRVLTAEQMTAHNTLDRPETVRPVQLEGIAVEGGEVVVPMPPKSVVVLTLRDE